MEEVKTPYTHCCFCATYNEHETLGYAGERVCPNCVYSGIGHPDLPDMAYKHWKTPPTQEVSA